MEIKEHDVKDLEKGVLRLGREYKSTPVDITGRFDDLEFIPCWKQIGKLDVNANEGEKWLWEEGAITKYGLDINPKFIDDNYICLDGRSLGTLRNKAKDKFLFFCNDFAAFFASKEGSYTEVLNFCLRLHSKGHEHR